FLSVKFLAKLLVGSLGIGGEAVEAGLHRVARLRQGLLEHLMLAIIDLAQSDDLFAQAIDGGRADGVLVLSAAYFVRGSRIGCMRGSGAGCLCSSGVVLFYIGFVGHCFSNLNSALILHSWYFQIPRINRLLQQLIQQPVYTW